MYKQISLPDGNVCYIIDEKEHFIVPVLYTRYMGYDKQYTIGVISSYLLSNAVDVHYVDISDEEMFRLFARALQKMNYEHTSETMVGDIIHIIIIPHIQDYFGKRFISKTFNKRMDRILFLRHMCEIHSLPCIQEECSREEQLCYSDIRRHHLAKKIQTHYRKAIANPNTSLCQQRLLRELSELLT